MWCSYIYYGDLHFATYQESPLLLSQTRFPPRLSCCRVLALFMKCCSEFRNPISIYPTTVQLQVSEGSILCQSLGCERDEFRD